MEMFFQQENVKMQPKSNMLITKLSGIRQSEIKECILNTHLIGF